MSYNNQNNKENIANYVDSTPRDKRINDFRIAFSTGLFTGDFNLMYNATLNLYIEICAWLSPNEDKDIEKKLGDVCLQLDKLHNKLNRNTTLENKTQHEIIELHKSLMRLALAKGLLGGLQDTPAPDEAIYEGLE